MSPRILTALSCALLGLGCSAKPEASSDSSVVEDTAAAPAAEWNGLLWQPRARRVADYGQGVIAFADSKSPTPRTDTLVFRDAPSADAAPVAFFLLRTDTISGPSAWRWGVKADGIVLPNLVEFDSAVAGVPTDSVSADRRWVRGLLGTDNNRAWVTGWTDARAPGLVRRQWATHLRKQPVFVLDSTTAGIANFPDSTTRPLPPDDYQLYATDSVRGRWLKVRLVSPSDHCIGPEKVARTQAAGWIEYLDVNGRPRVWYYVRGC